MKNLSKHVEALKGLLKRASREEPPPRPRLEPLQALVRGTLMQDAPEERVALAMAAIEREFVDLNELRVATELELREMLGPKMPDIEAHVTTVTTLLNAIFERENTLSLDRLKTMSRKDARQFLRELPQVPPFVEAYVMLTALDGAAMPVDDATLTLLRESGVVEETTTLEQAQKFIESHLKADEIYPLFAGIRRTLFAARERKKARA